VLVTKKAVLKKQYCLLTFKNLLFIKYPVKDIFCSRGRKHIRSFVFSFILSLHHFLRVFLNQLFPENLLNLCGGDGVRP